MPEKEREKTAPVGKRLKDVVEGVLEELKQKGAIQAWQRPLENHTPNFIVNGDTGIVCRNWDPSKMTSLNKHLTEKKITSRFRHRSWSKKILIIPKLKLDYERDKEECERLLAGIEIIDSFPWTTPSNMEEVREKLLPKIRKSVEMRQPKTEPHSSEFLYLVLPPILP
jgi:hypothetical protein